MDAYSISFALSIAPINAFDTLSSRARQAFSFALSRSFSFSVSAMRSRNCEIVFSLRLPVSKT